MNDSILAIIGQTPLVRLSRLFEERRGIRVYAKLELMNPNGSSKDRPAARIIDQAIKDGRIGPGSVVVESSSGNMAISLAAICSYHGMKFICVIDPKTSEQNIKIMKAYGAEIEFVAEPDEATGEFLPARLQRVQELLQRLPGSYWPNQYANDNNYGAHYEGTMREIVDELGTVDYVVGGVSTCGTMLGCSLYAREHSPGTKLVAVDAEGSVIFGGAKGPRVFPGLGAGIVPPFGQSKFMDISMNIPEREMVACCRKLVQKESILAGPSSGAVIAAMSRLYDQIPSGSVCAVILHDRGERYMDTVYSDAWVEQKFGTAIPPLKG
ncbi:2,3-diaminopropionate biosynthesis protein SbnA [Paenibacillus harenae]|uniref:2,3-diaminopropionate biosynthesis protein SbnA n=1 Tax=Paenibacillus harenae TaxID=306543 RepID=UPI00279453E1|nr:2,3-diaminopropionate biosynthesis protein SbnA [Paenibacillus harenae]MDQ0062265.1 cysteine synthase A [Paenibacillus harenae]